MQVTATEVIREAVPQDLEQIRDIYNHYVANSVATFDIEPRTLANRQEWFAQFSTTGPYRLFVAATPQIVGYACSTPFNARAAYRTSVETTVYIHPDSVHQGVGYTLYKVLLDTLTAEPGLHRAYAGISQPNESSNALHEKLGFKHIGTFTEVGYKFERYWDVARFEKDLSND